MKEVARYFTLTCTTKGGATGCTDVNGKPIMLAHNHTPSRTAVDYNFDVWVANRNVLPAATGQPSATKIANDPKDCIDRNKNGKIDTSADQDGDGKINVDCNGDGQFDSASTACTATAKPPEFLGDDDECILFTTNYGDPDDIGRSICLDTGKNNVGASQRLGRHLPAPRERARQQPLLRHRRQHRQDPHRRSSMPAGHHTYGCMADAHHIIWATDIGIAGSGDRQGLADLLQHRVALPGRPAAARPQRRQLLEGRERRVSPLRHLHQRATQHVWLGGWSSGWVLRYKPDRTELRHPGQGTWSRFDLPHVDGEPYTRGIAADKRGKVWVSINDGGYLFRLDQSLPDGGAWTCPARRGPTGSSPPTR